MVSFYGVNGMICDAEIEKDIYDCIKPFLVKGISKKVKQIAEVMKLEAHSEEASNSARSTSCGKWYLLFGRRFYARKAVLSESLAS